MEISTTYLSLGSNLGDRLDFLRKAITALNKTGEVIRCSKVYETPAWGFESEDHFMNICLEYKTGLSPVQLLKEINHIENHLGRVRSKDKGYQSRPIDIDIIFYDDLILNTENLQIPHAEYWKRNFVLMPLNDLVPEYFDKQLEKEVGALLKELENSSNIKYLQIPLIY